MTTFLIENTGQIEQPVTTSDGKTTTLHIGQNLIGEFDEDAVKRMRNSAGLRVTRRNPSADPGEPAPEPVQTEVEAEKVVEPAPKTKTKP